MGNRNCMLDDRRARSRKTSLGPFHYCCSDKQKTPSNSLGSLTDTGVMLNVSDSGLCFLTTCPLEEGQVISFHCPWLYNYVESGTIRWCREAATDLWRIGLRKENNLK